MMKKAFIALFIVSMLSMGMSAAEGDEATKTILDTAIESGEFDTLVNLLKAAYLADALGAEGNYTVFAPPDTAFEMLKQIVALGEMPPDEVADILKYHIAPGVFMEADLMNMTAVPTLQGGNLTIEVTDEGLTVDGANVTIADITCSNGVIHVIGTVLIPAEETVEEPTEETTEDTTEETVEEPESDVAEDETAEA